MTQIEHDTKEQAGRFDKRWEKTFEKMRVLKAEWLITRQCDLRCSYCRIRDESTLEGMEYGSDFLVDVVKLFAKKWPGAPMVVYGGEPTMHEGLPKLLRAGRDYDVKLPVISNSLRVMRDHRYAKELVDSGLENWSVSYDGPRESACIDHCGWLKSQRGLQALRMFRDEFGIRDLVVCVTVTKRNIYYLSNILTAMTKEGIHSIFTPLHTARSGYQYAQGDPEDLPDQESIEMVSELMYSMVSSGKFLCSNDAGWFKVWPVHFLKRDWMCNDKGILTIDADGSLKYCVDIPFMRRDRMSIFDLETEEGERRYLEIIRSGPPCTGCLWNPAYEGIKRARDPEIGIEEGRKRSRHYVDPDRVLVGGAEKWFVGNPELKRINKE